MYTKKIIPIFICVALILLFSTSGFSQHAENGIESIIITTRDKLNTAYSAFDEEGMFEAKAVFKRLMHAEMNNESAWLLRYYCALSDLNLSWLYYGKDERKQEQYVDEAIDLLKESIKLNDAAADTYALLARAYGSKIVLNPMRGMDLGIRSSNALEKAEYLEPENPRVFLIAGISALFTSELFGGGIEKAKEYFLKAASFFEAYNLSNPVYPNWGYAEVFAWLGQTAERQDDPVAAESYYLPKSTRN